MKRRLDLLLVDKGLISTRTKAKTIIEGNLVRVDGRIVNKPGTRVPIDATLTLEKGQNPYVSRGGLKLAGALADLALDPQGLSVLDGGASTGGFTDCLLQKGAKKVYAVDVGYGQLAAKIRQDERVLVMEHINLRHFPKDSIGEPLDLIVLDLSFISATKVLANLYPLLKEKGLMLILVKPQFEVGPQNVGKGGIVKDSCLHRAALQKVRHAAEAMGFNYKGFAPSCLAGSDGNQEFFLLLEKDGDRQVGRRSD